MLYTSQPCFNLDFDLCEENVEHQIETTEKCNAKKPEIVKTPDDTLGKLRSELLVKFNEMQSALYMLDNKEIMLDVNKSLDEVLSKCKLQISFKDLPEFKTKRKNNKRKAEDEKYAKFVIEDDEFGKVLTDIWSGQRSEHVRLQVGPFILNAESFYNLQNTLSDEIIDAYLHVLKTQSDRRILHVSCVVFTSMFYDPKFRSFNLLSKENLSNYDILVGVLNENGNHWTLLIVELGKKIIVYLDPLGEKERKRNSIFAKWLKLIHSQDGTTVDNDWKMISPDHARQEDGISCGVYVIQFVELYLNGEDLDFHWSKKQVEAKRFEIGRILIIHGESATHTSQQHDNASHDTDCSKEVLLETATNISQQHDNPAHDTDGSKEENMETATHISQQHDNPVHDTDGSKEENMETATHISQQHDNPVHDTDGSKEENMETATHISQQHDNPVHDTDGSKEENMETATNISQQHDNPAHDTDGSKEENMETATNISQQHDNPAHDTDGSTVANMETATHISQQHDNPVHDTDGSKEENMETATHISQQHDNPVHDTDGSKEENMETATNISQQHDNPAHDTDGSKEENMETATNISQQHDNPAHDIDGFKEENMETATNTSQQDDNAAHDTYCSKEVLLETATNTCQQHDNPTHDTDCSTEENLMVKDNDDICKEKEKRPVRRAIKRKRSSFFYPPVKKNRKIFKTRKDDELFCVCKRRDDGRLYWGCDQCGGWYHPACINRVDKVSPTPFLCDDCLELKVKEWSREDIFEIEDEAEYAINAGTALEKMNEGYKVCFNIVASADIRSKMEWTQRHCDFINQKRRSKLHGFGGSIFSGKALAVVEYNIKKNFFKKNSCVSLYGTINGMANKRLTEMFRKDVLFFIPYAYDNVAVFMIAVSIFYSQSSRCVHERGSVQRSFNSYNAIYEIVEENSISDIFRIGNHVAGICRMIIVKYVNQKVKHKLFRSRDVLRKMGLRISDDLSTKRREDLADLKAQCLTGYFKIGKLSVRMKDNQQSNFR
ncbi:Sentrin-specific protease 2 [Mactra antiquata]